MRDERSRKSLVVALVLFAVIGLGLGLTGYLRGTPQTEATRFYLQSDGGAVMFEHARHGETVGACVGCHHELAGDVHDCSECHDEDAEYTPDTADHDELLEIHDRACDGCHEIAASDEASNCRDCHEDDLSTVYHRSCNACHLSTAPDRFADQAGEPICRSCHLR